MAASALFSGCTSTLPASCAPARIAVNPPPKVAACAPTRPDVINEVLRLWRAKPVSSTELGNRSLGKGLEADLAAIFDARDLWAFASIGTIHDLSDRIAAGVPVLVGLQPQSNQVGSRQLALVVAIDPTSRAVTWRDEGLSTSTVGEEEFLALWRPVGFWMLTACRPEKVTWAVDTDQLIVRARLNARVGRAVEAGRDLETALVARPRDAGLWMELGSARRMIGQLKDAEAAYRKALELSPEDGQPLNNLAYQLAEAGRDLAEAEQLARRAVHLEPTNPFLLDTLGFILLRQSRFEEAEHVLQRAHQLAGALSAPQRGQIALHLARAHCGRGETARARALINQAMVDQPDLDLPPDLRLLLANTTAAL